MFSALLRLFYILAASIVIMGGALFLLRSLGLSQEFAPLDHPLVKRPYLVFSDGGDSTLAPPQSLLSIEQLKSSCPDCIPKIDARRSLDGVWYVYPSQDLNDWTPIDGYISLTNSSEIDQTQLVHPTTSTTAKIEKLEDMVNAFPDLPFLVVIHSRDASQLNEVLKSLEARKGKENLIIQSPFRQMLTDARKERPTWLFGVSPSGMARLIMMEALYIEPMADIWSDIIISPIKVHGTSVFTPRLIHEFKRRHKLIVLEEPGNLDQLPENLKSVVNGVITNDPQSAIEFFERGISQIK